MNGNFTQQQISTAIVYLKRAVGNITDPGVDVGTRTLMVLIAEMYGAAMYREGNVMDIARRIEAAQQASIEEEWAAVRDRAARMSPPSETRVVAPPVVSPGQCPRCGGSLVGDGYLMPRHCEFVECPGDREADAPVLYCEEKDHLHL